MFMKKNKPFESNKNKSATARLKRDITLLEKRLKDVETNNDLLNEDISHLKDKVYILGSKYFNEKYYRRQVEDFDDSDQDCHRFLESIQKMFFKDLISIWVKFLVYGYLYVLMDQ